MATITFDTLAYSKKLKAAGVPEKQAEVQAEAFAEIIDERLTTKQDIVMLQRDIKELEVSLKRDMKELELRLKHDLTIRMGTITAASIAIVAALVKLL
ncbi:MAG: hypothetical protein B6240_08340 [Desulfobacteraceae bacterium 4572_87]|nr:MAG: hypothetical protein B6240_08340 [Desulfobacteraceae bacterium 4572_87]